MTASNSNKKPPVKPHPDFPLFPHRNGQWAKKIKGRLHYFGSWSDPDAALDFYREVADDLHLGRTPRPRGSDELTVETLVNLFLASRERLKDCGELSAETYADYIEEGKRIVAELGRTTAVEQLQPEDFAAFRSKLGKGVGVKTLEGRIARVRAFFNWGEKNAFIDKPLAKIWGTEFRKPSRKALKVARKENPRMISAAEIWQLLKVASPQTAAMIWLGINCALGNSDIARVKTTNIDWEGGWLNLYRSKTGIDRRCPLWPETIAALKAAIAARPTPKDPAHSDHVFLTKYNSPWTPRAQYNPISAEFSKLREQAGITGKGKTFYALRHMFQTIGDQTKNFVAVSAIMGHSDGSISGHYRESIDDAALLEVSNHVRQWLLAAKPPEPKRRKTAVTSRKSPP